jgi:hypothetical protein
MNTDQLPGINSLVVHMARYVEQSTLDAAVAEAAERRRVRDQIARFFGWEVKSIRFSGQGPARLKKCLVEVPIAFGRTVEVVFADGFLVGIPPKKANR